MQTRVVSLRLDLPSRLASEVESLQKQQPELLEQILSYGLARRAVFAHLRERLGQDQDLIARNP